MLQSIAGISRRNPVPSRAAPLTALRHWAAWSVDYGSWRKTCHSIESRYSRELCRYQHDSDEEVRNRERYDQLVAEAAEDIIRGMPVDQRALLKLVYVEHPKMDPGHMARRMGMSVQRYQLLEATALTTFSTRWNGGHA
ncbi:hypothetical protein [Chitinolyticbacter meiyuanensis]|uniref:hypothetical protein n=1 Tax=Chitinolyticbacter meiyuanensis TaxID=682798 RepID=UPI0011E5C762|nr:hypothetical protein [Chitinolyticbacter meiyuanensis]